MDKYLHIRTNNLICTVHQAEIVWARRNSDEKMTFGLKFIDGENRVLDIVSF